MKIYSKKRRLVDVLKFSIGICHQNPLIVRFNNFIFTLKLDKRFKQTIN